MANNTSNISEHCQWARSAGDLGLFVTYKVITPFHFIVGLFGNLLCVFAFCRKVKGDAGFTYQIMLTINQICVIVCYAVYAATYFWWSGSAGLGARWFQSCYVCMWYAAHVSIPLVNVFVTNSLLLTLATSLDRIFALWKPFVYKNVNHKRHQAIAVIICSMVSAAINVFDSFRLYPILFDRDRLMYAIAFDAEYTQSLAAVILAHARNVVRFSAAIVLIVANAVMIYLYRNYAASKTTVMSSDSVQTQKKRAQLKVLVILAVADSFSNLLGMGCLFLFYTLAYTIPTFSECEGNLVASVVDGLIEMFDICDFYVVIAASQTFRAMIAETMPKWMKKLVSWIEN